MPEENTHGVRRKERYSHVYISVQVRVGDQWVAVKALDWNDIGFNFFIEHELTGSTVEFRKGPKQFSGKIAWTRKSGSEEAILETILNTLLFNQLHKLGNNKDIMARVVRLIRARGRSEEKRKLLSALDPALIAKGEVESLFEKNRMEHLPYRYGVSIDSCAWSEIVRSALEITSVVIAMDKIKKGLTGL